MPWIQTCDERPGTTRFLAKPTPSSNFFQHGWNPYSRFLDVDKVDLVLRRAKNGIPVYREIQVKFGKLYRVTNSWEQALFDVTSWRFFREDEFDRTGQLLFVAYVMSEDDEYRGDFFIFPVRDFSSIIRSAPVAGGKRRVYISRSVDDPKRWMLRRQRRFSQSCDESCLDVSKYRRNFDVLESGA